MRQQTKKSWLGLAGALAVAATLGGCWDDPADPDPVVVAPPTAASVPDSAGASVAAFIAFIKGLAANDETSEPLTISTTFSVPPEDTTEPVPLT